MSKTAFDWNPLLLEEQLTDDERMLRRGPRLLPGQLVPRVLEAFRHGRPTPPSSARWASWACWARPSPKNTAAPA
jgi:hypothetical protein